MVLLDGCGMLSVFSISQCSAGSQEDCRFVKEDITGGFLKLEQNVL